MGIIDVHVEKPSFKREETTDGAEETSTHSSASSASRRGGRLLKTVGAIGAMVVGIITLRKLRARRKEN